MTIALIVAAGSGQRLGADRPKALVDVAGRAMLQWSVDALAAMAEVEQIVVALPSAAQAPPGTTGVQGGDTRSDSVRLALAAAGEGDPVIVHDAARPLATPSLFVRALDELAGSGADAVIAALPVTDTVKEVHSGAVQRTLVREHLWAVQTPQVFRRGALERALAAPDELMARATDDAWLIEHTGGSVRVVPGEEENFKITTPVDLRVASLLLGQRGERA